MESASAGAAGTSPPLQSYIHGHSALAVRKFAERTAAVEAAFLLPHLRPGMDVVDLGCGPGSITVGLAEAVAPGEVLGIDLDAKGIARGRTLATERGIPNVRFEEGSAYEVPLPSNSADVVCAFNVLQHLADPLRVLGEARRLLRPGGIVAVYGNDHGTPERPSMVVWPPDSTLEEGVRLYLRLWQHKGGAPNTAWQYRALLDQAGFVRVEVTASAAAYGTPERVAQWGARYVDAASLAGQPDRRRGRSGIAASRAPGSAGGRRDRRPEPRRAAPPRSVRHHQPPPTAGDRGRQGAPLPPARAIRAQGS